MEPKRSPLHRALRSNPRPRAARGAQLSDHADRQSPVFELRRDPIVGRQVLFAEDRAGRPNDYVSGEATVDAGKQAADCPFCAGHEDRTPAMLLEVPGEGGAWQVRVVPNKYPAVALGQTSLAVSESSSLETTAQPPLGTHEVFIESPRHVQDITALTANEFACVLRTYRERLRHWSADERVRHCSIFKNVGSRAGASLEHAHSQLVALSEVPPAMAAELAAAERYHAEQGSCIFCDLIDQERTHRQRLVIETNLFVAFCAYAARQPYEIWILPREHSSTYEQLSDQAADELSSMLRQIVGALQTQLSPLSYNLILHTAPFRHQSADHYHWHFELVPRSTTMAGFEWGTGMHINPLAPERAAARLIAGIDLMRGARV